MDGSGDFREEEYALLQNVFTAELKGIRQLLGAAL